MSEIYINTANTVTLDVAQSTVSDPTAVIVLADETTVSLVVAKQTPTNPSTKETWVAEIPLDQTLQESLIKVLWTVDGTDITQYHEVVTPYVTPSEIYNRLGYQYAVEGDPGYQPLDRVVAAEKVARAIVERYTNANFGRSYKTSVGYGQQTDVLTLKDPVISIKTIWEDGQIIYDVDNDVNEWGVVFSVADSGFGIRVSDPGYDYTESERPSLVYVYGNFRYGHRYDVYGEFGSVFVPSNVKEAMFYVINDLLCQDAVYKNRYINHIQVKDWKFSFDDRAYVGTGNFAANALLEKYRVFDAWVV